MSADVARNLAFFVALLATTVALGPALAHAFELPVKIGMSQADYFTTQRIYAGWSRIAYVLLAELLAILALIALYRRQSEVMLPAVAALVFLVAAQAIFWIWTYPANVATANWTERPENWAELRRQWEYSHLAGAGFQLLVMASLVVAVLRR